MAQLARVRRRLGAYADLSADAWMGARMAARLPQILRRPITFDEACAETRERLRTRERTFLSIARRAIYEREGLVGVVTKFEYVTFNGERVTENNVEELLQRSKMAS